MGLAALCAQLGRGVRADLAARAPLYASDWRDAARAKRRVAAAAAFVGLASLLPALAFGEQFARATSGAVTAVQVVAATAVAGVAQALAGGQPLLIVGVAQPIVLVYIYMFDFAAGRTELGAALFMPWAAWACIWAAAMLALLALFNAADYVGRFTRYAGETFGALIALLFFQEAVQGLVLEFRSPADAEGGNAELRLVNGCWSLFLAAGLLLTAALSRTARRWRFLNPALRALLADYGAPLAVVAWTGLSFAVAPAPGVPSRVEAPDAWDVAGAPWGAAARMGAVPGAYVAAALVPAAVIAVLFFFDHSVSAQLAQQPEFGLKKPPAYAWVSSAASLSLGFELPVEAGNQPTIPPTNQPTTIYRPLRKIISQDLLLLAALTAAAGLAGTPPVNGVLPQAPMHTRALARVVREGEGKEAPREGGAPAGAPAGAADGGGGGAFAAAAASGGAAKLAAAAALRLEVAEQRASGLLQSLLVGVCLAAMPAVRWVPAAVLWGYFAFMAVESLPGSQLWDRTLLLLTDPRRRHRVLERGHAPYLETVPFRTVAAFTGLQLLLLGGIYGLTWAGVAGILFPIPIMLLVPLRQHGLPRLFGAVACAELDAAEAQRAAPLDAAAARAEAAAVGLSPPPSAGGEGGGADEGDLLDREMEGARVVRHVSRAGLTLRRRALLEGAAAARFAQGMRRRASLDGGGGAGPPV
jgi:hypothetical protein